MKTKREFKLLSLSVALALSACGSHKDQTQAFEESNREQSVSDLKSQLGVNVVDKVGADDYQKEYLVNRVYKILSDNKDVIKDNLKDAAVINIGNEFDVKQENGLTEVTISVNASKQDIIDFFSSVPESEKQVNAQTELAKSLGFESLCDRVGYKADDLKNFKSNLIKATGDIDLKGQKMSLCLSDRFVIEGDVLDIDPNASVDAIHTFLKDALVVTKDINRELPNLATELKVPVEFQVGVFNASELRTAFDTLKLNVDTYKNADKRITKLVVGKRFDNRDKKPDSELPAVVIVDYRAQGKTLVGGISYVKTDYSNDVTTAQASIVADYSKQGVTANINIPGWNMPNESKTMDLLKHLQEGLSKYAPASDLAAAQVKVIDIRFEQPTKFESETHTLWIGAKDMDTTLVSQSVGLAFADAKKAKEAADAERDAKAKADAAAKLELDRVKAERDQSNAERDRAKADLEATKADANARISDATAAVKEAQDALNAKK